MYAPNNTATSIMNQEEQGTIHRNPLTIGYYTHTPQPKID